jgi:hypothetical protein
MDCGTSGAVEGILYVSMLSSEALESMAPALKRLEA